MRLPDRPEQAERTLSPSAAATGVDTGNWPAALPEAQLRQLFQELRHPDAAHAQAARQHIIQHNLRLVAAVVRRWCSEAGLAVGSPDEDDLFQSGCVGLVQAVDRFDPGLGYAFSTYAVPFILGELRAAARARSAVHWTRGLRQRAQRLQAVQAQLRGELQREPTLRDLQAGCGLSAEEIVEVMEASQPPVSLSQEDDEEGEGGEVARPWAQRVGTEDPGLRQVEEGLALRQALQSLPARHQILLELRFVRGRSQLEVAHRLGLSQSQVSRLERQALRLLRRGLASETEGYSRAGNCREGETFT